MTPIPKRPTTDEILAQQDAIVASMTILPRPDLPVCLAQPRASASKPYMTAAATRPALIGARTVSVDQCVASSTDTRMFTEQIKAAVDRPLPTRQYVASATEPQLDSEQAAAHDDDAPPIYPYTIQFRPVYTDRIRPEKTLPNVTDLPDPPRDLGVTIGDDKYRYPSVSLSAKMIEAQENYDATSHEMIGCRIIVCKVAGLSHRSYQAMILLPDHKPLRNILRDPSSYLHSRSIKHKRWPRSIEDISEIPIDIKYIEGPLTVLGDYLSRCLDETDELL
ncbi:hypothetical protein SARC_00328 [Sphaeroforma arctica JP610]|uniref:Uncharacterized protein n=1 Tax=Sphaeroforma arctica JP610 TaxID=667725 RepID=A0A0L0GGW9_9EUKA|nr:hypothetical protein SARC_00328 [Sphaeroforma arctica JP610]KNC87563.1 hypothetical protein SARC_00328 [Sphaeroforma arctica JP610]|eukprot:XP_014161465.1 hypothetical protein SARC_00328 [Sphaeroforma arctica JP610]